MEIKLEGNFIITSDSMNYTLSEWKMVKDNKGKTNRVLSKSSYHNTLESTLKKYKDRYIRNSNCETIKEILEVCQNIEVIIEETLEGN